MSGVGLDWYKREPLAYLKDTIGLSSREHAVYSVVIDLIYQHGGSIPNDPGWIAGWISDMGTAAVRNTIAALDANPKITLVISDGEISQKRAKNEAKTKEKLRENRQKTGKKGGEISGKNRAAQKENNNLTEPSASSETQAEKRRVREEYGGGGRAREADPPPVEFRERILSAMGVDPVSGLTGHGGRMIGTRADMAEADRWQTDLRLSEESCLAVVSEVMAKKRDGPPKSFSYFTPAMQRLAGDLAKPKLTPIDGGQNGSGTFQNRRPTTDDICRAADAIAEGFR